MDFLSRAMSVIEGLPDPLIYSIIAVVASGAVYSTIHHLQNWRPRHTKRVKLKGVDGRKIEDCTSSNYCLKLPTDSDSVDIVESWNTCSKYKLQCRLCVHFLPRMKLTRRAKKILVERALGESCRPTLLSRLESVNSSHRMEALVTLRYIFDFKHKTRSSIPSVTILIIRLPG